MARHDSATGHRELLESGPGRTQGQPVTGAVSPQRGDGAQDGVGVVQLELGQGGPADLELDPPHLRTGLVPVAPDLLPPVGPFGRHLGRLVVDAGADALGAPGAECEARADVTGPVGGAGVAPAEEVTAVLAPQNQPFDVAEQVEARHVQHQPVHLRPQELVEVSNGARGTESAQELGPGLDPDRRQPGARGEADAAGLVVETKAVLPHPCGASPNVSEPSSKGTGSET